jgi:putative transposase
MPWKETCVMDEKRLFIHRVELEEESISEVCEEFGISRKTGYKWITRYRQGGFKALEELSRRPRHFRDETPAEVICELIRIRQWKDDWGGRKIRSFLKNKGWEVLPSARTIDRYLKRCGFVIPVHRSKWQEISAQDLVEPRGPNDVWTVDWKGWWRTLDGKRCNPLTIRDSSTRYVLNLSAHQRTTFEIVKERFIEVFSENGLPLAVRSDNGPPFGSIHRGRHLTRLAVWFMKLGILPNYIPPASPQYQGAHERYHLDLYRELEKKPAANVVEEQKRFKVHQYEFNFLRPHEALNNQVPAKIYAPSKRSYPGEKITFEYPVDFDVRKVNHNGVFFYKGVTIPFAKSLAGEYIGLEFRARPHPRVWYCDFSIGFLSDSEGFVLSNSFTRSPIGVRVVK